MGRPKKILTKEERVKADTRFRLRVIDIVENVRGEDRKIRVQARVINGCLAYHECVERDGKYSITHVLTGLLICNVAEVEKARDLCVALNEGYNWTFYDKRATPLGAGKFVEKFLVKWRPGYGDKKEAEENQEPGDD